MSKATQQREVIRVYYCTYMGVEIYKDVDATQIFKFKNYLRTIGHKFIRQENIK